MVAVASQADIDTAPTVAVVFSRGIRSIRHLKVFADVDLALSPSEARAQEVEPSCVLVWGRKSNTQAALLYAREHNLPVQYLEDGWIRSSASNPHSRTCYSILKDTTGVYYDSSVPNDLENLLNLSDDEFSAVADSEKLSYAKQCRERLIASNITKYNFTSLQSNIIASSAQAHPTKPCVMVIDQTRDDASVRYGGMDASGFERMLQSAVDENPDARVVVRMHPDVVSGRREGYLKEYAEKLNLEISADAVNPIAMLKRVDKVYVGTSQLGYEALLCNKPVAVFGQPFYAGWGLSDDRAPVARRIRTRSIDQLFYASHIALARYCNPVTGQPWQLHQCLEHVELQQSMFAKNAHHFECVGITAWKRKYVRQFLRSPDGTVTFQKRSLVHTSNRAKVTWGYRGFSNIKPEQVQVANDLPLFRLEDGFLRSMGLGSDFNAPASLVVDGRGLYFDPARESDLEALLNDCDCTPAEIFRAVALKKLILSSRLSKYNVGTKSNLLLPAAGKAHVLVVGQVEDDESIRRGCDKVHTNVDLLKAVRQARPDAWICYKPHPDVVAGNRKGAIDETVLREQANAVETEGSIVDCIEACDELHTMTSLSGFEALIRGKRVVAYGAPFYAGWGLTEDHQPIARRKRRRTLDELVYLSLIAYPRYVDIETGEFTTPEDLVQTIISHRAMNKIQSSGWSARQLNKMANIVRGLRYAP